MLGFTKQQIEHCINNSIPDTEKAQALIQQLRERQDLISLGYISLNCAIMVFVYKHKSYTLPDTITQLYEAFLTNSLKRHVDKYEGLGKRVRSLDRLPDNQLQACLQGLCKLAFEGLENDQSTFYIEELEAELSRITPEGDLHSKLLGIMNAFYSTNGVGIEESYQFLHRTVQEFLAARYASELPVNNQLSFLKKQLEKFDTVVVFLAGLTQLADPVYKQYFESEVSFRLCMALPESGVIKLHNHRLFLGHLHLVYEAQNIELCRVLPKCVENQEIVMRYVLLSPFYCRVLAYCIINSGYCWMSLDLRDCRLSECCLEAFMNVQPSEASGFVKEVIFTSGDASSLEFSFAGLSLFPSIPLFQHVEVLKVGSHLVKPVNGLIDGFAKLLQIKSLVSLSFYTFGDGLGREFVPCRLLDYPTQISPSLQTLYLIMPWRSDSDEMKCLAISLGRSNVTKLQLCIQNSLLSVLFPSLLLMKNLETLSLRLQLPFRLEVHTLSSLVVTQVEGLQKMLETSGTLKNLELYIDTQIWMTEDAVQCLADGLSVNRPLTALTFSSTKEFSDLSPIFKALQHKKNLERLYIQNIACPIKLNIDPKPQSVLSDLREALISNVCLQNVSLICEGNYEIKYVADGLINHPSLESITIINSVVETPIASRLLKSLHSCPALHSIKICSRLTACGSQVQDESGCESEIGDLTASLLQE